MCMCVHPPASMYTHPENRQVHMCINEGDLNLTFKCCVTNQRADGINLAEAQLVSLRTAPSAVNTAVSWAANDFMS